MGCVWRRNNVCCLHSTRRQSDTAYLVFKIVRYAVAPPSVMNACLVISSQWMASVDRLAQVALTLQPTLRVRGSVCRVFFHARSAVGLISARSACQGILSIVQACAASLTAIDSLDTTIICSLTNVSSVIASAFSAWAPLHRALNAHRDTT